MRASPRLAVAEIAGHRPPPLVGQRIAQYAAELACHEVGGCLQRGHERCYLCERAHCGGR
eukprot:4628731-Pleurochrysis_carterae.AAC.1